MLVGTEAKVPDGLARVLGTPEDQGVAAGRRPECKLVQGDGLATGGSDAGAGSGGESKSGDCELGERGVQAVVVGDGANHNNGTLLPLLGIGDDSRQGDGRAVDLGHEQASEDDLVEGRVGTT